MSASLVKRAVRRARRVPGYRWIRRKALDRLRSSDTARDVVTRVFAGSQGRSRGVPQRFPSPGSLVAGVGIDQLPVAVISLLGVDEAKVGDIVDEVARLQLMSAAFRPVLVLQCPRLDAARRYDYVAELLVEPNRWHSEACSWEDYAVKRLSDIIRRYGARVVVSAERHTLGRSSELLLASLRTPTP